MKEPQCHTNKPTGPVPITKVIRMQNTFGRQNRTTRPRSTDMHTTLFQ
jgi:hypothetical protein